MLTAVTNVLFAIRWWVLPVVALLITVAALTIATHRNAEAARVAAEQVQRNAIEQRAKEKELADHDEVDRAEKGRLERKRQDDEQRSAAQRLAEQRKAAQLLVDRDRRAGYLYARSLPSKVDFIVCAATVARHAMDTFAAALVKYLRGRGKTASNIVFSPTFVTEGAFDSFFAGRGGADLQNMPVSTMGNRLFLARISINSVKPGTTAGGLFTASVSVSFSVLSTNDGSVVDGFSVSSVGAGTSGADGTARALEQVVEQLGQQGY